MSFLDNVHYMIFHGSLKKGGTWGGSECANAIPLYVHYFESIAWCIGAIVLYYWFDIAKTVQIIKKKYNAYDHSKDPAIFNTLDIAVAALLLGLWGFVLRCKIYIYSLVNLLQPCHLVVIWQAFALLFSNHWISPVLAMMTMTLTIGAVLAVAVPATEGLDLTFEKEHFFLQHYVILLTPIYFLVRKRFFLYHMATTKALLFSIWCTLVLHWGFFVWLDRRFEVNVNFFLCPSEGMEVLFKESPGWLFYPSYRTFLAVATIFLSLGLCYCYVGLIHVIHFLSGAPALPQDLSPNYNKKSN